MLQCVVQLSFQQDLDYLLEQLDNSIYNFVMDNRGPCLTRDFTHVSSKSLVLEAVVMDLIERNIKMDSINVYAI